MTAEILSTGEEVRIGTVVDFNSAYIAQELETAGLHVLRHTCVGDDIGMLADVMREISKRADVAVVTGGLGPTQDDLTSEAAAKAGSVDLVLEPDALAAIENRFRQRNRPMPPTNRKQALFPKGAEWIPNPVGTAPGFLFTIDRCLFFFLPGVPSEMRRMMADAVLPRVGALQGEITEVFRIKTLSLFGMPEAEVGERLAGIETEFPSIKLGLRATFPVIQVKLYARGKTEKEVRHHLQQAAAWSVDRIGSHLFSAEGRSMEEEVGPLLRQRKATIAVAESCTGGLISHWLTNVPGSSDYFLFSGVTYANETKIGVLGVSPETIATHGAVHEQTAREMAIGARRIAGATYGLSTSGIAGPDGGTPEKPVGTVCIGLATPHGVEGSRYRLDYGERVRNKTAFAMKALDVLRRALLGEKDRE